MVQVDRSVECQADQSRLFPIIVSQQQKYLSKPQHNKNIYNITYKSINITMGNMCRHAQEEQTSYSTKAIVNDERFGGLSFYFTTENLMRLDNECLLFFTDPRCKIRKNTFLRNVSRSAAEKVQEYATDHLKGRTMKPGQVILFQASIVEFTFNYFAVLCLDVWGGVSKVGAPLEKCLEETFELINKSSIKSLIITDFNEEFGIPIHVAQSALYKALMKKKQDLKVITMLCLSAEHQNYLIASFSNKRTSVKESFGESVQSESVYY